MDDFIVPACPFCDRPVRANLQHLVCEFEGEVFVAHRACVEDKCSSYVVEEEAKDV